MALLLDTHVLFWFLSGSDRLSARHRTMIEDGSETVFVSAVTGWEIAGKVKLGKWPEAAVLLPDLAAKVVAEGLQTLDLTLAQAEYAGSLPLVHKDPFDRFLAAQSVLLYIPILTADPAFRLFGCKTG